MINLRLKNNTFEAVKNGTAKILKHGYSCNKKYLRLFNPEIKELNLLNEEKTESFIVNLKAITVELEKEKQIFKIELL